MGSILDILKQAGGIIGGVGGAINDTIASTIQLKETKRQKKEFEKFSQKQQLDYDQAYADILNQARGMKTYQSDISGYNQVLSEAQKQQSQAQVNPADQLYRESARQSSSNYIENAGRGAKSGTDLMSIAGFAAANENNAMQDINAQTASLLNSNKNQANQNVINSLGNRANAMSQQNIMQFNSENAKQNNILKLLGDQKLGALDLASSIFNQQMAKTHQLLMPVLVLFQDLVTHLEPLAVV